MGLLTPYGIIMPQWVKPLAPILQMLESDLLYFIEININFEISNKNIPYATRFQATSHVALAYFTLKKIIDLTIQFSPSAQFLPFVAHPLSSSGQAGV